MPGLSFAIRALFAGCLLVATANHLHAGLTHGLLWDYGYGDSTPWASRLFWGALTFLDPLAALLLFRNPRPGILFTAAIIVVDVIHNTFYVALNRQWLETFYISQTVFLLAVLLLAPVAWKSIKQH
ncbi:hypothetical protein C1Y08_25050 [Pseudomonas sp. FW306-02-F02-AA]|uniref:Uncharacterized protein n=1 Tax=Pseudomonas fluorescens TaxID=294 RepID=A0A0N9VUM2_PSEFL|nr:MULTISPECIES: hypothetical protein [Pseudomonas]ALI04350.1 hypothetical protein AO353_26005 [Pseudomonas fluorescens]PMZ01633.1 hypothetical protein C1Y07_24065 [Pseudomonas sp. FW306-02-F02-AB]PMZ10156.1 hypothetical protein C1Y06_11045 [Pseudomonas sp. FW306-02-H06C]PMZ13215.1 hypothetical protein C1Y08_25050 [Pseudomonas sp. FW306-02-F02-AA]PMZ19259.1 hypothetical protein C1Y09_25115 [Pseudomonas sp. FW306-02-F08-AA]